MQKIRYTHTPTTNEVVYTAILLLYYCHWPDLSFANRESLKPVLEKEIFTHPPRYPDCTALSAGNPSSAACSAAYLWLCRLPPFSGSPGAVGCGRPWRSRSRRPAAREAPSGPARRTRSVFSRLRTGVCSPGDAGAFGECSGGRKKPGGFP